MHNRTGDRSAVPPNIRSRRMPRALSPRFRGVAQARPSSTHLCRGAGRNLTAARVGALSDLSVAQILEAAGVGRTSFYEHFSSKEDVVVKLMRSVSLEVAVEIEPMFDRGERSPDEALAEGIENLMRVGARYAPLLVAASEEWPGVSELREIWFAMLADATARLGATIERDRAAGSRPRAPTARRWRRR